LRRAKEQPVCSQFIPGEQPIAEFLRELRGYRGTLSGSNQALLDALVRAGLGFVPRTPLTGPNAALWQSYAVGPHRRSSPERGCDDDPNDGWRATPWGKAHDALSW
jgi:hypothetical protein